MHQISHEQLLYKLYTLVDIHYVGPLLTLAFSVIYPEFPGLNEVYINEFPECLSWIMCEKTKSQLLEAVQLL